MIRKANSTYYIRISAVDAAGNESVRTAFTARTLAVTPPSNIRASNITTSNLDLAWDDNGTYGVKYKVYASRTKGFTPSSKTLLGELTECNFSCTNLRANSTYYIRISAVDVAGNESVRAAFTARTLPIQSPTNVRLGNITASSVEMAWDTGDMYAVKYRIYISRRADFAPSSKMLAGEATSDMFTSTDLSANTTYYIRLSAVDVAGNESARTKAMKVRTNVVSL